MSVRLLSAQTNSAADLSAQVRQLTDALARTQTQLQQSQRQLDEMRQQLTEVERRLAQSQPASQPTPGPPQTAASSSSSSSSAEGPAPAIAAALQDIRERQTMEETQIATHDQTKIESESKYPLKITGLLLLNGFVNTRAVDMPATPTVAIPGSGTTGVTVRQTVLGVDAFGPHLLGARSYADLRVDFDGSAQGSNTAGFSGYFGAASTLLRLRTAHAGLQWSRTDAYFSLDRPIFSPDSPTSLTAVAEPALAWSGNLWAWSPRLGVTQDLALGDTRNLGLQAALVDVGDAPGSLMLPPSSATSLGTSTSAERSRWPGLEARIALLGSRPREEDGNHFGVGGYFAPHLSSLGKRFDSWAGTLDTRVHLPAHLEFTGSFYRGLALGGLGGGAYKDFAYIEEPYLPTYYSRPLDDVGGWVQLKERLNERLELNAAFGLDNVFAGQLRPYLVPNGNYYQNLARNRTYTGNFLYSPSAYLLFSVEYRHLVSSPVIGSPSGANVIGLGAGFKF
ncbi:MAG TPA: hypothetical protein VF018_05415 [Acidobacteriaceae bacterium]